MLLFRGVFFKLLRAHPGAQANVCFNPLFLFLYLVSTLSTFFSGTPQSVPACIYISISETIRQGRHRHIRQPRVHELNRDRRADISGDEHDVSAL